MDAENTGLYPGWDAGPSRNHSPHTFTHIHTMGPFPHRESSYRKPENSVETHLKTCITPHRLTQAQKQVIYERRL